MKKIFVFCVMFLTLLTSCGKTQPPDTTKVPEQTSETSQTAIKPEEKKTPQKLVDPCLDKNNTECKKAQIMASAMYGDDTTGCDTLGENASVNACKDSSYFNTAMRTGNIELCAKLSKADRQPECIVTALVNDAIRTRNPGSCTKAKTDTDKENCRDRYFEYFALESHDINMCMAIKNDTKQTACRGMIMSNWQ